MTERLNFFPKVGEIAHHGVVLLTHASSVEESVAHMGQNNLSTVIFSQEGDYKIFTVDDLLKFRSQALPLSTPLGALSTSKLECVDAEENVLEILQRFDRSGSRYLGVTNQQGLLTGVVSYTDVVDSVDPSVMMERKTLGDVLNVKKVEVVGTQVPTDEVLRLLSNVEDAVLVQDGEKIVGVLTTKDVVRIISDQLDTSAPVSRYMTSPVDMVSKDVTVKGAISYLKEKKFKRAIVMDDASQRVIGMVSQRDLINSTYGRWADLMKLHAHELDELIHVLEEKNRKLQEEALTDTLTGVGNRRRVNQSIEAEVGRYYRHGAFPFSLLMLDVDHFKKINDTLGHPVGDEVLRDLCKAVAALLRVSDLLGRWGGEEFVILLPNTEITAAEALANRVCKMVEATPLAGHKVTVSIGVAAYRKGESIDEFIAQADEALYRAKSAGRNRVVAQPK